MDPAPATPAPTSPEPAALLHAWPRSAQLTTAFLLGIACTLLALQILQTVRWGARPMDLEPRIGAAYRLDLNRADRAELLQVPGLGPALAERIEAHRRAHGPFTSVDQLADIPGVGPATLERFRPWFRVEAVATVSERRAFYPPPEPTAPARAEVEPPAPVRKQVGLAGPLDINRADVAELQQLPGIGPILSQRILDERAKRPFATVDELRRVPGIGPKTLEKLRPHVTVGNVPLGAEGV